MSDALDRTKRSLDLIPYILEHQGISIDELAQRFNVPTELLYEDLNMIFCCGLPGYTPLELIDMNLDDGYVSISNPQVLDTPRKLSKQKLLRLLLGLQLCEKFSPEITKSRIKRLQSKISELLKQSSPVEIVSVENENDLKIVVDGIQKSKYLKFKYVSANSDSKRPREIVPLGISESMKFIYVEGLENESSISKNFRLDRMSELSLGDKVTEVNQNLGMRTPTKSYKLFVSQRAASFLTENSAIVIESHSKADGFEVVLREVSENWLIGEIFAFGGEVRVLEPKEVMAKVAQIATERLHKS